MGAPGSPFPSVPPSAPSPVAPLTPREGSGSPSWPLESAIPRQISAIRRQVASQRKRRASGQGGGWGEGLWPEELPLARSRRASRLRLGLPLGGHPEIVRCGRDLFLPPTAVASWDLLDYQLRPVFNQITSSPQFAGLQMPLKLWKSALTLPPAKGAGNWVQNLMGCLVSRNLLHCRC